MRRLAVTLTLAVLLGIPALAAAQPSDDSAAQPSDGETMPARPYQSPMRDKCNAELDKDPTWQAQLERRFEAEFQQRWATRFANDRRHVIMAYAALWILTAAFLAFLWLRQHRLVGEIGRLEEELKRAIAEEEAASGGGATGEDDEEES